MGTFSLGSHLFHYSIEKQTVCVKQNSKFKSTEFSPKNKMLLLLESQFHINSPWFWSKSNNQITTKRQWSTFIWDNVEAKFYLSMRFYLLIKPPNRLKKCLMCFFFLRRFVFIPWQTITKILLLLLLLIISLSRLSYDDDGTSVYFK